MEQHSQLNLVPSPSALPDCAAVTLVLFFSFASSNSNAHRPWRKALASMFNKRARRSKHFGAVASSARL